MSLIADLFSTDMDGGTVVRYMYLTTTEAGSGKAVSVKAAVLRSRCVIGSPAFAALLEWHSRRRSFGGRSVCLNNENANSPGVGESLISFMISLPSFESFSFSTVKGRRSMIWIK